MINQSDPTRPMVMLARIQAMEVVVTSQNLIAWVKVGVGGSYMGLMARDIKHRPPILTAQAHEFSSERT